MRHYILLSWIQTQLTITQSYTLITSTICHCKRPRRISLVYTRPNLASLAVKPRERKKFQSYWQKTPERDHKPDINPFKKINCRASTAHRCTFISTHLCIREATWINGNLFNCTAFKFQEPLSCAELQEKRNSEHQILHVCIFAWLIFKHNVRYLIYESISKS